MPSRERGSAVVDFVLVTPLVLLLAAGVLQVTLALLVRSTLASAAVEGSRAAALSGSAAGAGEARVQQLVADTVAAPSLIDVSSRRGREGGLDVVITRIDYRLPLAGLLVPATLSVEGRVLVEGRS